MDAIIARLLDQVDALKETLRVYSERFDLHCSDGVAHPHAHDLDLASIKSAVDGALSEAADAAIKEHEAEEHSDENSKETSEEEPESEPMKTEAPSPEPEKEPERVHVLHRRIG